MSNRLSYSALRLFSECGQRYKYHYVDRLRERVRSGALFFGTAFDKAIEASLQNPSCNEKEVFDKVWLEQDLNGVMTNLSTSTEVVYAQSDMDWELLTEEDMRHLNAKCAEADIPVDAEEVFAGVATKKKSVGLANINPRHVAIYNLANWMSLRRKGHVMLEAHRTQIMPKIKAVKATQAKIELSAGEDSLIGYADAVLTWETDEDIIFDYKTSSRDYEEDSVLTSPQLTIYAHSLGIKKAGYIVFNKQISKNRTKVCATCKFDGTGSRAKTCTNEANGSRCGGEWTETIRPEARVQIIIDTIPERTEDIVVDNIDMINKAINAGIFVRNFNACKGTFGLCPYYKVCYNNDCSGLEKLDDKKS